MNCPYCNKHIYGMTGLQEATKFAKHLDVCAKNPNQKTPIVTPEGNIRIEQTSLKEALEVRANSGQ